MTEQTPPVSTPPIDVVDPIATDGTSSSTDGTSTAPDEMSTAPDGTSTATVPDVEASEPAVFTGVDVVSIQRIEDALAEFGESFERRVFTPEERRYCTSCEDPPQHYAARWATKEAFRKVLADEAGSAPLGAIGVTKRGERPVLSLEPPAEGAFERRMTGADLDPDCVDTAVSLSHDRAADVAAAQVVAVGVRSADVTQEADTSTRQEP